MKFSPKIEKRSSNAKAFSIMENAIPLELLLSTRTLVN